MRYNRAREILQLLGIAFAKLESSTGPLESEAIEQRIYRLIEELNTLKTQFKP